MKVRPANDPLISRRDWLKRTAGGAVALPLLGQDHYEVQPLPASPHALWTEPSVFKRVTLEMSLKPFRRIDAPAIRSVCEHVFRHFLIDLGFDYIWFSNGFGFSATAWSVKGPLFDGEVWRNETSKVVDTPRHKEPVQLCTSSGEIATRCCACQDDGPGAKI
jgi:hypothetical protein